MGSEVTTSRASYTDRRYSRIFFVSFSLCLRHQASKLLRKKKKKTSRKVHPCELPIGGYYEVSK